MSSQIITADNVDACVAFLLTMLGVGVRKKKKERSCLCCGVTDTVTWRPSEFGRNTLCNRCGLKWIESEKRDRTLDLILYNEDTAVWVVKKSGHWAVLREADKKKKEVSSWIKRQRKRKHLAHVLSFKKQKT